MLICVCGNADKKLQNFVLKWRPERWYFVCFATGALSGWSRGAPSGRNTHFPSAKLKVFRERETRKSWKLLIPLDFVKFIKFSETL